MDPIKLLKTNTTKFILPMIVKDGIKFNKIFEKGFVDSYIGDLNKPEYDDKILIIRNEPYVDLEHYSEDIYISTCIDVYLINNDNTVEHTYVHEIPFERMDDYGKFLQNKVYEFSEEYKQRLLSFWNINKDSIYYCILYNDRKGILKKLEEQNKNKPMWSEISLHDVNKTLNNSLELDININDEIYGINTNLEEWTH